MPYDFDALIDKAHNAYNNGAGLDDSIEAVVRVVRAQVLADEAEAIALGREDDH